MSILMLSAALALGVACIIMLSCDVASADATPVTVDNILERFHEKAKVIGGQIEKYAVWLFWCLAIIEFSWAAIQVGVRGDMSLGALWSMVFKQMMMIGIFWWLLDKWPTLAKTIVGGLGQDLAYEVGGSDFSPTDVVSKGIDAFFLNCEAGWKAGWSDFFIGLFSGIVIFLAFSLAAASLCVYMVEWYVGIPIGVLILGLGGSSWTKNYVETYIRFLVSLGIKILSVKIILMIIMSYLDQLIVDIEVSAGNQGFLTAGATLASLSGISYMLIKEVPGIASSMLSGAAMQSGASTLASAVAGAKNNISSISNAAQTATQSATNAGAKMYSVGKAASQSASAAYKASKAASMSSSTGGDNGGGGGTLQSALRSVSSTAKATAKGAFAGTKTAGKMTALGAAKGIAKWAGISKEEEPIVQMSRNVAAIANKLGVNDTPEKNEITQGKAPNDPVKATGGASPKTTPADQHGEDASQKLKDMEQATNEEKRGDAV